MMKIFIAITALVFSMNAHSQMKEGRVVYERVVQLPVPTFNVDPAIASQIPKSRTDQFELLFTPNHSLWQYLPSSESDADMNFHNGGTVIRFATASNDISYFDFTAGTRLDQRELLERTFLVSDSIRKQDWKLVDETKTILNYTAKKATSTRVSTRMQMSMENGEMKRTAIQDTATVVAWFTTDIPVPAGPEMQGQLPGLILELDIDNGQTIYKAIEVDPKVNTKKIKAPRDGKKLTAEEFARERESMMEEMRKNNPNGRIRIQN